MPDLHEIYPNAPLALVAAEVKFPNRTEAEAPKLSKSAQTKFRDRLGSAWVIASLRTQQVSFSLGASGVVSSAADSVVIPRFTVRDRTTSVALTSAGAAVETTNYVHFPDFSLTLRRAIDATGEILQPDGVARVGIRYINEIRLPDQSRGAPTSWRDWLDSSLLAGLAGSSPVHRLSSRGGSEPPL